MAPSRTAVSALCAALLAVHCGSAHAAAAPSAAGALGNGCLVSFDPAQDYFPQTRRLSGTPVATSRTEVRRRAPPDLAGCRCLCHTKKEPC